MYLTFLPFGNILVLPGVLLIFDNELIDSLTRVFLTFDRDIIDISALCDVFLTFDNDVIDMYLPYL